MLSPGQSWFSREAFCSSEIGFLGSGRCSFPPLARVHPATDRGLGFFALIGKCLQPPQTLRGRGLEKVPGQAPHSSGFWGARVCIHACKASVLLPIFFFQTQNTAEPFPCCVLSSLLSRGIWGGCAAPQGSLSTPQPGLGLSTHHGWGGSRVAPSTLDHPRVGC